MMFQNQGSLIQEYAEDTVRHLMQIPATSNYLNFQSLLLLATGTELAESITSCEMKFARDFEPCIR